MTTIASTDAWANAPILHGTHVRLEPLQRAHADALREAVAGWDTSALWFTQVPDAAGIEAYVGQALAMRDAAEALPFLVRDADGAAVGSTRFYRLDAAVPRLCIGYTWHVPRVQRTGLNTEAKRLLLAHAFETMGCAAVTFETSWFNHASRTAIARLGAKQDGVLRHHMRHPDGTLRDTVVFSILDSEWPAVRGHLDRRLARGGGDAARFINAQGRSP